MPGYYRDAVSNKRTISAHGRFVFIAICAASELSDASWVSTSYSVPLMRIICRSSSISSLLNIKSLRIFRSALGCHSFASYSFLRRPIKNQKRIEPPKPTITIITTISCSGTRQIYTRQAEQELYLSVRTNSTRTFFFSGSWSGAVPATADPTGSTGGSAKVPPQPAASRSAAVSMALRLRRGRTTWSHPGRPNNSAGCEVKRLE